MGMAEYIEREEAVCIALGAAALGNTAFADRFEIAARLRAIPAADVRPVVLCRDCKFAPIGDKDGSDLEWPFNEFDENPCPYKCLDNWYSHKPAPDFFCAAGEKREES